MLEDLSEICIYIYIFIYIYIYIYLLNVTSYRSDNYVFNGEDKITKTINKAKKQVFLGFYQELEDENELCFDEKKQETTSTTCMLFAKQRKGIVRLSTLYSFKAPFELLLAGIADVRFLANLRSIQSIACFFVCLFTSKIYT